MSVPASPAKFASESFRSLVGVAIARFAKCLSILALCLSVHADTTNEISKAFGIVLGTELRGNELISSGKLDSGEPFYSPKVTEPNKTMPNALLISFVVSA